MYLKKLSLLLLLAAFSASAWAQNKYVNNAEDQLKSGHLDKAKQDIDLAAANSKTSDKAKTWFLKGQIYAAIGADSGKYKNLAVSANDTALDAFRECLKLDPKFPSLILTNFKDLGSLYSAYWKAGADAFNNKDYSGAFQDFKKVKEVNDLLYSLHLGAGAKMDTMAIYNMGNAAYNMGRKDTADKYYQILADAHYKEPFIYKVLLNHYRASNEKAYMNILDEGKALFPDDQDFTNEELNYYSSKGETDKLIAKLQEDLAKKPNDYSLNLNLGITYDNLANPKDANGNDLPAPANQDEYLSKAIAQYKKCIELKPDEYAAPFNLGLLYYNDAAHIGKEMSKLGSDKASQATQDSLVKVQNSYLNQSLPYLNKAYSMLDSKASLTPDELTAYKNAIMGLQGIYARENKMDLYNALKQKLAAADSKVQ